MTDAPLDQENNISDYDAELEKMHPVQAVVKAYKDTMILLQKPDTTEDQKAQQLKSLTKVAARLGKDDINEEFLNSLWDDRKVYKPYDPSL